MEEPVNQERYRKGAHTVLDLKYHFVWKTKYSYRVLSGNLGLRLRDLLKQIAAEKNIILVKGHIRPDHVHVLVSAPAHLSPSKIAQILKGKSSYRLQREFPELRKRYWGMHLWSRGYFCSTIGAITEEQIKAYIENQEEQDENFKIWDEKPKLPEKFLRSLVKGINSF